MKKGTLHYWYGGSPVQLVADNDWIEVRLKLGDKWFPIIRTVNTTSSGGTVDHTVYPEEIRAEAEKESVA